MNKLKRLLYDYQEYPSYFRLYSKRSSKSSKSSLWRLWISIFAVLSLVFFLLSACAKDSSQRGAGYRSYKEPVYIVENANNEDLAYSLNLLDEIQQKNLAISEAAYSNVPASWKKIEAKGLRFASFKSEKTGLEVSLVSFPGDVGGLEANVSRWMRQLNLLPEASFVSSFSSALPILRSESGLPYILADFSVLVPSDESDSIVVAILRFSDETLFIKIQGKKKWIELERAAFISFVNSFYESKKG